MTKTPEPDDHREINRRLDWIDRRRIKLRQQLAELDQEECQVLGLHYDPKSSEP